MAAVNISGCVLTVWASSSAGPSETSCHRSWFSVPEASSNVERTTTESPYAFIIPTDWEPCPGNTNANAMIIPF